MVKVLLAGDVEGHWDVLFKRALKLNSSAHGPFDVLLCVGNMGDIPEKYMNGELISPLPTYFISSNGLAPTEIPNVDKFTYLGPSGVQTIAGLTIAYLSGHFDSKQFNNATGTAYDESQVNALIDSIRSNSQGIDILLTSEYPKGFDKYVDGDLIPNTLKDTVGVDVIRQISAAANPRYHIAGLNGVFFQRPAYQNSIQTISRFISLGRVPETLTAIDKSRKWMHALNLVPASEMKDVSLELPKGTTRNPFLAEEGGAQKRKRVGLSLDRVKELEQQSAEKSQFFYQQTSTHNADSHHERRGRRRRDPIQPRTECWFCLATPTIEKHLITSIGMESYLTLPKGGITPDHMLIVPIEHISSMFEISPDAALEVEKYKQALRDKQDKSVMIFERHVHTEGAAHAHVQIVPIPNDIVNITRSILEEEGSKREIEFEEFGSLETVRDAARGQHYFYAELPDETGTKIVRLLHIITGRHYLQFGRHVAATILNLPRRADWKYCISPFAQEKQLALDFKKEFKPYDFTLEE